MSKPPVLVLQMQRMGDLILTFPLLALLQQRYPGHPVWTVAEPRFFQPLYDFSPNTVFFPPEAHAQLRTQSYRAVVNLSHRPDAAAIAGSLEAEQRFGAYTTEQGSHVGGYWSLYRASLVQNNRHNLFHWGDLSLLDHVDLAGGEAFPRFGSMGEGSGPGLTERGERPEKGDRVGLFVGASEREKRPDPEFFGQLARALLRKGLRPIFLGGPDDVALGQEAQRVSGIAGSNHCGQYSLSQLAVIMRSLALFVTPDTGPMHLAVWLGTPVLNLSLGPVNAWETGPLLPGHHVLRPGISCAGCWHCPRTAAQAALPCHAAFQPARVALVAHTLLHNAARLPALRLPGLRLFRTNRDIRGLHVLAPLHPAPPTARHLLARFWQEWFWARGSHCPSSQAASRTLRENFPRLAEELQQSLGELGRSLSRHLARHVRHPDEGLPQNFWQQWPLLLRPFSGHAQLRLQNASHALDTWEQTLHEAQCLTRLLG